MYEVELCDPLESFRPLEEVYSQLEKQSMLFFQLLPLEKILEYFQRHRWLVCQETHLYLVWVSKMQ